jgi:hypothetical protein
MIREADVDRPAVAMDERVLIDPDRIRSVALWMGREGLALGHFVSASSHSRLQNTHLAEIGEQLPKAPSRIAESHPVVVIANTASVLQHGVEDGTTTEDSALGQSTRPAIQVCLRHRL